MNGERVARLVREGPRIDIEVSARPTAGKQPRRVVPATLLIDTGAGMSTLRPSVIRALGLTQVAESLIAGVTDAEPVLVPVYLVRLTLPGAAPIEVEACALTRDGDDVDGLLGRDVLSFFDFTYRGTRGSFTLEPG